MKTEYIQGPCPTCGTVHNKHVSLVGFKVTDTLCNDCLLFVRNGNAWGEEGDLNPPLRLGVAGLIELEIDHARYRQRRVTPLGLVWWEVDVFGPPTAPMVFPHIGCRWVWPHAESARHCALSR